MPDTVGGIPLHPLVVHAVVVLVPLAALGILALAVVPRWSRTYGTLVLIATVVAVGAIPVATHTGERLRANLPDSGAIENHASLGDAMKWFGLLLLVAGVAVWWLGRRRAQDRPLARGPEIVVRVVCVVLAVGALAWVVRTGHSGAETVWKGVGVQQAAGGGSG